MRTLRYMWGGSEPAPTPTTTPLVLNLAQVLEDSSKSPMSDMTFAPCTLGSDPPPTHAKEPMHEDSANVETPWTTLEDIKADDDKTEATYHMPQDDWATDGDDDLDDDKATEHCERFVGTWHYQVKASGRAQIETRRAFDMRQVWWKCFKNLMHALGQTKGTVFGGAALYWFQVDVLRKRMYKWLNTEWQSVQNHDGETCLFLNPSVDPTNARRRLTLRRPGDVDVWFHSSLHLDEAMILLRGILNRNVKITPLLLGAGKGEWEGSIYSSSPFAKALVRHRRFLLTFDVFPMVDTAPWPSRLIEPLKFIMDCTYPVVALPSELSWPWQLTPYPTKVKCLGIHQRKKVGADTTLASWRLLESASTSMLVWQPLACATSQAYLWDLCDRIGAFKDFFFNDYELLCRQCVMAYVRRLYKELSSDLNEEEIQDAPVVVEAEVTGGVADFEATYGQETKGTEKEDVRDGNEATAEGATKTDKDKAEFDGVPFTLTRAKRGIRIIRNDTKESQTWLEFRHVLYQWCKHLTIWPSVVSLEGGQRHMQWRCPWRLDMDTSIPRAVGEPLILC